MTTDAETKDYAKLSVDDAVGEIERVSAAAKRDFGMLSADQLNWKPGPKQWSVGECLEHLIRTNGWYFGIMDAILAGDYRRPFMSRIPGYASWCGRFLIQAVSPQTSRKVGTVSAFAPARSTVDANEVAYFADEQRRLIELVAKSKKLDLAKTMIASPATPAIVYSLLDAWRLIAAHEVRHLGQARRVTEDPSFPRE